MSETSRPDAMLNDPALRALLVAGGLWLWDADLVQETTKYQPGFWEQYGFETEALTDTFDFLSVVENADKPNLARQWRAHLDGEAPIYHSEWRLRTPSGERHWISAIGSVIEKDAMGRPTRMVGTYADISASKSSALSLAESLAELDAVFRGSRDGLVLVSPEFLVLRLNTAASELIRRFSGMAIAEGGDIRDLPATEPGRPVISDVQRVLSGNELVPDRSIFAPATGVWVEFAYAPIYHPDGASLGVAITIRDSTERKRLEQGRLQAVRLESLGLMASGIAHDFNNLLMGIMGNIELATIGLTDDEAKDSLKDAQAAARRAAELVDQLLAFSGKQIPVMRPIELSAMVAEMVRYVRKIPGLPVEIREDLAAGLPTIAADATQMRQLVLNLLVNALEAARETNGSLTVSTAVVTHLPEDGVAFLQANPASAYLVLRVTDDGPGMEYATVQRIFDPFFTTKASGHGLGLATALGVARSHGGAIVVDSAIGRGSSFSVFLPIGG